LFVLFIAQMRNAMLALYMPSLCVCVCVCHTRY